MRPTTSPLEHLTAFSIVFAAGILSAVSFATYMELVRRNAIRDHYRRIELERDLVFPVSTKGSAIE